MFKRIAKLLRSYATVTSFDPKLIDDPLARQTEWSPLKNGGTNFCTHRIQQDDPNRMTFKATLGAKLFYGLFFTVGLAFIIGILITNGLSGSFKNYILLIMGLGFTSVGGFLFYTGTKPIIFDLSNGMYWKSYKSPMQILRREELQQFTELKNIHALQIIDEYCSGDKSKYYSYELNLILKDGTRLNVIDHGSYKKLQEDAQKLAEFLRVPLWDKLAMAELSAEFEQNSELYQKEAL